ncbi:type II toxin-antitoxin system Phd/YefM family antitoxin [Alysiella filiformis]|uniref:Antitoxin n=1 Tax=Alysiella filiformis DSM 16848 TaxID=1120981 RepID=A0A286E334_9NEIS|nr:type II toxin-antitoxin system prevent-host-death family antitoxin [Alysiella filiformis]QMT31144.1 type II toxin-antitoxin system prevent-host-death family antitoxin [Alysiella filiformis]UBQ55864.1 type II toxin-antitoxin system prevent-host-death family antitoxin [Alysiella filiformis DSM 16848]SOD65303.1 prevent-host-death family protein [Alysiella filiformis DSM 16848]
MSQTPFVSPPPEIINIHEAKTHLSRIVEEVKTYGKPVIIAKAGKPQVQIVPIEVAPDTPSLFGFMQSDEMAKLSQLIDEFDEKNPHLIEQLFAGEYDETE